MGIINRGLVVVKPKQPFLDWLRRLPAPVTDVVLDSLRTDCNAYLLPEWEQPKELDRALARYSATIFEEELRAWHTEEERWPERTAAIFREWFDVEPISVVINLVLERLIDDDLDPLVDDDL